MRLKLDDESADALCHAVSTCCEDDAFFEDCEDQKPFYFRVLEIIEATQLTGEWLACEIDIPDDCVFVCVDELENQLDIAEDNRDFLKRNGISDESAEWASRCRSIKRALKQLQVVHS